MSVMSAPFWCSSRMTNIRERSPKKGRTYVHTCIGLGSTQTLLFSCESDRLENAPEGDPSFLDALCDAENRDYTGTIVVSI